MNQKLTLNIKKSVVEKAKKYAKDNNQSLSKIIETFLYKLTKSDIKFDDKELNSIRGIISLPDNLDAKKESRKIRIKINE